MGSMVRWELHQESFSMKVVSYHTEYSYIHFIKAEVGLYGVTVPDNAISSLLNDVFYSNAFSFRACNDNNIFAFLEFKNEKDRR